MKLKIWYYAFMLGFLLFAVWKKIETGNSFDSVVDIKSRVDLNFFFAIDECQNILQMPK